MRCYLFSFAQIEKLPNFFFFLVVCNGPTVSWHPAFCELCVTRNHQLSPQPLEGRAVRCSSSLPTLLSLLLSVAQKHGPAFAFPNMPCSFLPQCPCSCHTCCLKCFFFSPFRSYMYYDQQKGPGSRPLSQCVQSVTKYMLLRDCE